MSDTAQSQWIAELTAALVAERALADALGRVLAELMEWMPASAAERGWWTATAEATLRRYRAAREARENFTCTEDCRNHIGMGQHAEVSRWHHLDCPNHTSRCCPGREPGEVTDE